MLAITGARAGSRRSVAVEVGARGGSLRGRLGKVRKAREGLPARPRRLPPRAPTYPICFSQTAARACGPGPASKSRLLERAAGVPGAGDEPVADAAPEVRREPRPGSARRTSAAPPVCPTHRAGLGAGHCRGARGQPAECRGGGRGAGREPSRPLGKSARSARRAPSAAAKAPAPRPHLDPTKPPPPTRSGPEEKAAAP